MPCGLLTSWLRPRVSVSAGCQDTWAVPALAHVMPPRKVLQEVNRLESCTSSILGVGQPRSIQWIQLLKTKVLLSCQQGFLERSSHWTAPYPNSLQNISSWNRSVASWCNLGGIFQTQSLWPFLRNSIIAFRAGCVPWMNNLWLNQFLHWNETSKQWVCFGKFYVSFARGTSSGRCK